MKTKYPIVLVHGLAMKDTFFMKTFGRIDRILRIQGYEVHKSRIDSFGSVENNAAQLKEELLALMADTGADKVNIVAHSKGGLDAKYMIARLDMADSVASLTTLCTPHKGSPVASFVLRFPRWMLRIAAGCVNGFYRLLGDRQPDSLTACEQLRRRQEATEPLGVWEPVLCQSYSSTIHAGDYWGDLMMSVPLIAAAFVEKRTASDGMVPQDSAVFGHYRGECTDASLSHTEIIDFFCMDRKKDKVYAFYSGLCEELARAGL